MSSRNVSRSTDQLAADVAHAKQAVGQAARTYLAPRVTRLAMTLTVAALAANEIAKRLRSPR